MFLETKFSTEVEEINYLQDTIEGIDVAMSAPDFNHQDVEEVTKSKEYFAERIRTIESKIGEVVLQQDTLW